MVRQVCCPTAVRPAPRSPCQWLARKAVCPSGSTRRELPSELLLIMAHAEARGDIGRGRTEPLSGDPIPYRCQRRPLVRLHEAGFKRAAITAVALEWV